MMTARVGGVKINDINPGRQGCEITFVCEERAEVQGLLIWYVVGYTMSSVFTIFTVAEV